MSKQHAVWRQNWKQWVTEGPAQFHHPGSTQPLLCEYTLRPRMVLTAYICSGLTLPASALSPFSRQGNWGLGKLHNMLDMKSKVSAQAGLLGGSHACLLGADETLRDGFLELQPEMVCCKSLWNDQQRHCVQPHSGPISWGHLERLPGLCELLCFSAVGTVVSFPLQTENLQWWVGKRTVRHRQHFASLIKYKFHSQLWKLPTCTPQAAFHPCPHQIHSQLPLQA